MMMCLGPHDVLGPDGLRAALESLEPSTYLGSIYYERWMKVIERALLAKGFLTKEELDAKMEHFREHTHEVPVRRVDPALAKQTVDVVWDWNTPTRILTLSPSSARVMQSVSATSTPKATHDCHGMCGANRVWWCASTASTISMM